MEDYVISMVEGDELLHKKGGRYKVLVTDIKHSETLEHMVLYQSLSTHEKWVRPHSMFTNDRFQVVVTEDKKVVDESTGADTYNRPIGIEVALIDSHTTAIEILSVLKDNANRYGYVTVYDYYSLVEGSRNRVTEDFGWPIKELEHVCIKSTTHGYVIDLPQAVSVKELVVRNKNISYNEEK